MPGHGKVVIDGVIQYLSVSGLSKADEEHEGGCLRRWWFRYVAGKEEPSGPAALAGVEFHKTIAHYLTTGEDVLSPVLRAGRDLMPRPGEDLLCEAEYLGRTYFNGIPALLKIDLMHDREFYVSTDGDMCMMGPGTVEVIDHKTTKDFKWAKTGIALGNDVQMIGYGALAAGIPGVTHVRLSHIYYRTQGAPAAIKVTTILPSAEVLARAEKHDRIARQLRVVATATRPEDVKPNFGACGYMKGCAHRAYCPRTAEQELDDLLGPKAQTILNNLKGA